LWPRCWRCTAAPASRRSYSHTRQNDKVTRLGGDEFGILSARCVIENAIKVANLIREPIANFRFDRECASFSVGVSIDLVSIDGSSEDMSEIMRRADSACYSAKGLGRNQIVVFNLDDLHLSQRQGEAQRFTQIEWLSIMIDLNFITNLSFQYKIANLSLTLSFSLNTR
jgi:predicted signal transduction protein with EAL and GGDEF domain